MASGDLSLNSHTFETGPMTPAKFSDFCGRRLVTPPAIPDKLISDNLQLGSDLWP
jgi:hypothetical protein